MLVRAPLVAWCRASLPKLDVIALGRGLHFLQQDHTHAIGEHIAAWERRTVVRSITSFAASALVVLGPSRSRLASIEYWVGRSPVRRQMLVVEPRRDLASR